MRQKLSLTLFIVGVMLVLRHQPSPVPGPGPVPPTPVPVVGFDKVVLVTDPKMTSAQMVSTNAKDVQDYLTAKAKGGFKVWEKGIDASQVEGWKDVWPKAQAAIQTTPAVVIIGPGQNVNVFPFPPGKAELLALLQKYGG